jgi:hypothetical protein
MASVPFATPTASTLNRVFLVSAAPPANKLVSRSVARRVWVWGLTVRVDAFNYFHSTCTADAYMSGHALFSISGSCGPAKTGTIEPSRGDKAMKTQQKALKFEA